MNNSFIYTKDKDYEVIILRSRRRTIRFDYKNGQIIVKAPTFASIKIIKDYLEKYFDRLVTHNPRETGFTEDYVWIFGTKYEIENNGTLLLKDGSTIKYKNFEDLKKKIKAMFLEYCKSRNSYYENVIGLYQNEVKVRDMVSRYGSNMVDEHKITYNLLLVHYDVEVIDSVIIHELCHCKIRGHDKSFYDYVLKYCPNYKKLHDRLAGGIFHVD